MNKVFLFFLVLCKSSTCLRITLTNGDVNEGEAEIDMDNRMFLDTLEKYGHVSLSRTDQIIAATCGSEATKELIKDQTEASAQNIYPKSYYSAYHSKFKGVAYQSLRSRFSKENPPCEAVAKLVKEGLKLTPYGMDFSSVMTKRNTQTDDVIKPIDNDIQKVIDYYYATKLKSGAAGWDAALVAMDHSYLYRYRNPDFLKFASKGEAEQFKRDGFLKIDDFGLEVGAIKSTVAMSLGSEQTLKSTAVEIPALAPLLKNQRILELASYYLGSDVKLTGYKVLRLVEQPIDKYVSQLWHHDRCGTRLKLFIYLEDVNENSDSPITEVARGSQHLAQYHYSEMTRFDNAYVQRDMTVEKMTGRRGGGFIFDTNTIHRGNVVHKKIARDAVVIDFENSDKLARPMPPAKQAPCPEGGTLKVDQTFKFPSKQ